MNSLLFYTRVEKDARTNCDFFIKSLEKNCAPRPALLGSNRTVLRIGIEMNCGAPIPGIRSFQEHPPINCEDLP